MKTADTVMVLFMLLATVSAAFYRGRRDHDDYDYSYDFTGDCSEARYQQLQEWIPEGCPPIRDTLFGNPLPPNECCNERCSQYLYESINECYGEEAAFNFEQECSRNATGTQCYQLALPRPFESLDLGTQCDFYSNNTYCSRTCIVHTMALNETHGCCLFVALWLNLDPFYVGAEREALVRNDLSNCNVSAGFCPPSFSESVIGVPPIVNTDEIIQNDSTVNVGLITGLTVLAGVLVTFPILILILLLLWLRIRRRKRLERQVLLATHLLKI